MAEQTRSPALKAWDEPHTRLTLEMLLLLLGAQLTRGLDLPWRVAGIVFSALALVQGLRAMAALRRHRRGHPDVQAMGPTGSVLIGLGVALAAALTALQVLMLAFWPLVAEQDACRERALTRTAVGRCDDALLGELDVLRGLAG